MAVQEKVQRTHEQDIVAIYNPTNRDFTKKWGGVSRTVKAHQTVEYPRFLAEHIAKHLADFILQVKAYQYKKKYGKDIMLVRNKKEREKVMSLIVRNVTSFYLPADDGTTVTQKVAEATEEERKNTLDLGEVEDDTMGRLLDDVTIDDVPEARRVSPDLTKQQIMEQLDVLGVEYSDRETKAELLKKMGVVPTSADMADDIEVTPPPAQ